MKILVYEPTGGYWPYTPELVEALGEKGEQVYFLTSEERKNYAFESKNIIFLPIIKALNKKIKKDSRLKWIVNRISNVFFWITARNRIIKLYNPDILHIQSTVSNFDQFILPRLHKKIKIVFTVHDVLPSTNTKAQSFKALKRVYSSVDILIVHSKSNKSELIELFNIREEKIKVIPHGVNTAKNLVSKKEARNFLGVDENKHFLLFFGGLRKSKGIDLAVKTLVLLNEKAFDIHLIVAGSNFSDIEFSSVYDLAARLKIEHKIIWNNEYIKEENVKYYFVASDIVLLPYIEFHSQSGVLLQAYKYGIPVVATNIGSLGETITNDKTGIVVNNLNPEAISDAILAILSNDELAHDFSKNELKLVNNEYNWKLISSETVCLYNTLF